MDTQDISLLQESQHSSPRASLRLRVSPLRRQRRLRATHREEQLQQEQHREPLQVLMQYSNPHHNSRRIDVIQDGVGMVPSGSVLRDSNRVLVHRATGSSISKARVAITRGRILILARVGSNRKTKDIRGGNSNREEGKEWRLDRMVLPRATTKTVAGTRGRIVRRQRVHGMERANRGRSRDGKDSKGLAHKVIGSNRGEVISKVTNTTVLPTWDLGATTWDKEKCRGETWVVGVVRGWEE